MFEKVKRTASEHENVEANLVRLLLSETKKPQDEGGDTKEYKSRLAEAMKGANHEHLRC